MSHLMETASRSPLKETDANSKKSHNKYLYMDSNKEKLQPPMLSFSGNNTSMGNTTSSIRINKKRNIEALSGFKDIQRIKKKNVERSRSIEGAIRLNKNGTVSSKKTESKTVQNELQDWQNDWKKIMKRESIIYFDTTDDVETTKHNKIKLEKRANLLKKGFLYLEARIRDFFDSNVTIVITKRNTEKLYSYGSNDILVRAKRNGMKVWDYKKAARFLKNLDVDIDKLDSLENDTSLSNLLENEKLYGPNDRDPKTRRDDVYYFKNSYVYMYDLWQFWAPIITLEWKQNGLQPLDPKKTPYPILKYGTFGRCPFIGDGNFNEMTQKRVFKRYHRDKLNKKYALRLRKLYQYEATPNNQEKSKYQTYVVIPHDCLDSSKAALEWQNKTNSGNIGFSNSSSEMMEPHNIIEIKEDSTSIQPDIEHIETTYDNNKTISNSILDKSKVISTNKFKTSIDTSHENHKLYKDEEKHDIIIPEKDLTLLLRREETEEIPDDLGNNRPDVSRNFDIKASGVHQSNDLATSFGNGLGPTRASVTNKNIKNLSRMVVDRKLGVGKRKLRNSETIVEELTEPDNSYSKTTEVGYTKDMLLGIANKQTTSANIPTATQLSHNTATVLPIDITEPTIKKSKNEISVENSKTSGKKFNLSKTRPAKEPAVKNPGYCENCRVKYDDLEYHIHGERHQSFASMSENFELIDSLIEKLNNNTMPSETSFTWKNMY